MSAYLGFGNRPTLQCRRLRDPMEVEAREREAPRYVNVTRREIGKIEARGGDTAPTNNGRANGGLASFAQPGILRRFTLERYYEAYWPPLVSDGDHHMVGASPQRSSVTALGSWDSSLRSQDARRGANSFAMRGRLGGGMPTRSQQGCRGNLTGGGVPK